MRSNLLVARVAWMLTAGRLLAVVLALGGGATWPAASVAAEAEEAAPRMNIVLMMLDNCGQEWFGCYGSAERATPRIDRLAADGAKFEACYTVPICGPSRAMLLTGRYPYRTGWTMHHDAALYSGGGLDPAREVTLARPLREAGYATAVVGKWQIDNLYDHPQVLREHGFDRWCVWPGSIDRQKLGEQGWRDFREAVERRDGSYVEQVNHNIESRYWDAVLNVDGETSRHEGEFGPDIFQQYAYDFIRAAGDQPFFVYYPMTLTHGQSFLEPVVGVPPERKAEGVDGFREMVRYADRQVGEMADFLEAQGLMDNTVLIACSDNGTEHSMTASFRGREVHGELYSLGELGVSVPMVFYAPGRIRAGLDAGLADFSDLLPTICDLAGVPIGKELTIDGVSHAHYLLGHEGATPARDWIFVQYATDRVVRAGQHKLYSDGRLTRLTDDLSEVEIGPDAETPEDAAQRAKLAEVLASLPEDTPLPFARRSISAFKAGVQ